MKLSLLLSFSLSAVGLMFRYHNQLLIAEFKGHADTAPPKDDRSEDTDSDSSDNDI